MRAVPGAAPMAAADNHDVADGHGAPNPERDELVGVRELAEPGDTKADGINPSAVAAMYFDQLMSVNSPTA